LGPEKILLNQILPNQEKRYESQDKNRTQCPERFILV